MTKVATKTVSVKLGMDAIKDISAGFLQDMYKEVQKDIATFGKNGSLTFEDWEKYYALLESSQMLRSLIHSLMEEDEYQKFIMVVNDELYR